MIWRRPHVRAYSAASVCGLAGRDRGRGIFAARPHVPSRALDNRLARPCLLPPACAEHSLCWKLKQSSQLGALYCLPGNAGIAAVAECVSGIGGSDVPKVGSCVACRIVFCPFWAILSLRLSP